MKRYIKFFKHFENETMENETLIKSNLEHLKIGNT